MNLNRLLNPVSKSVRNTRTKSGFSLVSVMLFCILALAWLTATFETVLPVFRYIGKGGTVDRVDCAAESAVDYALHLLNSPSTRGDVDPELNGGIRQPIFFSPATVATILPGGQIVGTITKISIPTSSQKFYPGSSQRSNPTFYNQWRLIDVTATFGATVRNLKVVACPSSSGGSFSSKTPGTMPFFAQAGFTGINSVWLGAYTKTQATNGGATLTGDGGKNIGGDISSSGKIILDGNAEIGGRLQIVKDTGAFGSAINSSSASVNQYLQLNSSGNGGSASQIGFIDPFSSGTTNVFNDGLAISQDGSLRPTASNSTSILGQTSDAASQQIAPAYSAPDASLKSQTNYVSGDTLKGGDYTGNTVNFESGVNLNQGQNTSPVRLFLQGNDGDVATFNGDLNTNGNPANLQIWYNGSGNIVFNSAKAMSVNATIYAPNAKVIFRSPPNGLNQPVKFTGAISADSITGGTANGSLDAAKNVTLSFPKSFQTANNPTDSNPALKSLSYAPSEFQIDASNPYLRWTAFSVYDALNRP